jgi:uncharacterized membrane protein
MRTFTLTGLFAALVALSTMVIHVPVVATGGFVNVGDAMIFIAGILLGGKAGLLAGGIGSALADVLLGYSHWAPWTLVIKGIEGWIAGRLGSPSFRGAKGLPKSVIMAQALAAAWMVLGYYLAGGFMLGFKVALTEIPANLIQGGASILFASILLYALRGVKGIVSERAR